MNKTEDLKVSAMTCNHCVMTITNAVKKLNGVIAVTIDLARKNVQIVFNEDMISLNQIKKAIQDAGYPVEA